MRLSSKNKVCKGHPMCDLSVGPTSREFSCPGELQGRNLCPLLVAVTTSAENLGDAACYKVGVRMKVWRIISFYQIPISLS